MLLNFVIGLLFCYCLLFQESNLYCCDNESIFILNIDIILPSLSLGVSFFIFKELSLFPAEQCVLGEVRFTFCVCVCGHFSFCLLVVFFKCLPGLGYLFINVKV